MTWLGRVFRAENPFIEDAIPHLHFVITGGREEDDWIVLVPMTSKVPTDAACILYPGDADCASIGKYLTLPSTIEYRDAKMCQTETLAKAIQNGSFESCGYASPELIARIQDGALKARKSLPKGIIPLIDKAVADRNAS